MEPTPVYQNETRKDNRAPSFWQRYLPILNWALHYDRKWLKADLIAGLTVWAVMVPEAMAYAGIAGVPALYGLYSVPIPLFVYAILGTSRTMIIGPDTATAMISAAAVGGLAASGSDDFIVLTAGLAMMVGALFFLFGLLRMGWIANFVPTPVMKGFIQGLVWVTILGQIPKLLDIAGGHGNFVGKSIALLHQLPSVHVLNAVVGIGSLALLMILKHKAPRVPAALTVAGIAIAVSALFGLDERGVDVVGEIRSGLPSLQVPRLTLDQIQVLIPAALAIVMLGFSETLGAARAAAERTGEELDPNQELISHGPANLGSALCSGFLVVGSLSKTSVAMSAGARTQLTSIVTGVLVILSLLFLLPLFRSLPHATLAAIVIEAMLGLANFQYLKNLRTINPLEFGVALFAFFGVLLVGVLEGIGLGVLLSLALLVRRNSFPPTAVLGRLPGQDMYRDIRRHPEATQSPGLLIFRFSSDLIYTNANHFADTLKTAIAESPTTVRYVIIDGEAISTMDTTAMARIQGLLTDMRQQNITLSFARLRDDVRELMQRGGLEPAVGEANFHERITDAVNAFQKTETESGPSSS